MVVIELEFYHNLNYIILKHQWLLQLNNNHNNLTIFNLLYYLIYKDQQLQNLKLDIDYHLSLNLLMNNLRNVINLSLQRKQNQNIQ